MFSAAKQKKIVQYTVVSIFIIFRLKRKYSTIKKIVYVSTCHKGNELFIVLNLQIEIELSKKAKYFIYFSILFESQYRKRMHSILGTYIGTTFGWYCSFQNVHNSIISCHN